MNRPASVVTVLLFVSLCVSGCGVTVWTERDKQSAAALHSFTSTVRLFSLPLSLSNTTNKHITPRLHEKRQVETRFRRFNQRRNQLTNLREVFIARQSACPSPPSAPMNPQSDRCSFFLPLLVRGSFSLCVKGEQKHT